MQADHGFEQARSVLSDAHTLLCKPAQEINEKDLWQIVTILEDLEKNYKGENATGIKARALIVLGSCKLVAAARFLQAGQEFSAWKSTPPV